MLEHDGRRRVAGEGHVAGERLVDDDAERVDVGARVYVGSLRALFGRHVLRRADDEVGRGQARIGLVYGLLNLGDAEVQDLRPVAAARGLFEHDVVALEVAVDDALGVRRV